MLFTSRVWRYAAIIAVGWKELAGHSDDRAGDALERFASRTATAARSRCSYFYAFVFTPQLRSRPSRNIDCKKERNASRNEVHGIHIIHRSAVSPERYRERGH